MEIHTREKEFLVVHYITKRFAPQPKEGGVLSNIKFLQESLQSMQNIDILTKFIFFPF